MQLLKSRGLERKVVRRIGVLLSLLIAISAAAQDPSPAEANPSLRVVVSIPDRKLAVTKDGEVVATFSVAVGASGSPSPMGKFQIISRVSNPTYYRPGSIVPSGRNNPVGTRWVGLSQKGYGIHGTNAPRSVGQAASHGCIRLRNQDMERLFKMVRIGDVVEIHGERDDEVAEVFGGTADETVVAVGSMQGPAGGQ
jgi:L,D-transpeptidase ErfK/SrfK